MGAHQQPGVFVQPLSADEEHHMRNFTSVFVVVLLIMGCGQRPAHVKVPAFTTVKPREEDLVGKYMPTPGTLSYIKQKGNCPAADMSIILLKDGSFRFENIPDWWHTDFGRPNGKFDSGSGKWWVSQTETPSQNWCRVSLNFSSTEGFNSKKYDGQFATSLLLVGEGPPYQLHLTVGDPDSDEAMHFHRVEHVN